MALPKRLARGKLLVTNRVVEPFAPRLPGFAIVSHFGAAPLACTAPPVNLYRADDHYVITLTYGSDSQWVRNVLAAGAGSTSTRTTGH